MEEQKWFVGDRVTRKRYLDDGTWERLGDSCLPGPLRHGVVVSAVRGLYPEWVYGVRWDDGQERYGYLRHGLDREPYEPPKLTPLGRAQDLLAGGSGSTVEGKSGMVGWWGGM